MPRGLLRFAHYAVAAVKRAQDDNEQEKPRRRHSHPEQKSPCERASHRTNGRPLRNRLKSPGARPGERLGRRSRVKDGASGCAIRLDGEELMKTCDLENRVNIRSEAAKNDP